MPQSFHAQLLVQARRLAQLDPKKPKQVNLRRAVSSAYYALFHFLAGEACIAMLGAAGDRRPYRDILARAFQHAVMDKACRSFAGQLPAGMLARLPAGFAVAPQLRTLARTFSKAQERRHLADYDRAETFNRAEVLALVRNVEQAIASASAIRNTPEYRFFLGCLLAWGAIRNR